MSCKSIPVAGGYAIACGRGISQRDRQELSRFAAFLEGDVLAYTDAAEERLIAEDLLRFGGRGK